MEVKDEAVDKGRVLYIKLIDMIDRYVMDNQVEPTTCLINPDTFKLIAIYYYSVEFYCIPIQEFNISGVKFIRSYDMDIDSFVLLGIKFPLIK